MAKSKFLPDGRLSDFVAGIGATRAFVNALVDDTPLWKRFEGLEPDQINAALRRERPINPFKSLLLPARELVARYGSGSEEDPLEAIRDMTIAVVGVRGCECRALSYLDEVMYADPVPEPFYKVRRENLTVVSVDCAQPCETCFCDLLGAQPYAEDNFDLNLSPVDGGFVVESGSERGDELLESLQSCLKDASEAQTDEKEKVREEAIEKLAEQNSEYNIPEEVQESLPQSMDGEFWRSELGRCVQCGGCTAVCPTCYCFLLSDRQAGENNYERTRVWDSCQFTGYSVMAGPPGGQGPDPRRSHMSKFQHRFAHKFWYDPTNWEMIGCVGCGRCAQTCPGEIDLRRVLSEVNKELAENG